MTYIQGQQLFLRSHITIGLEVEQGVKLRTCAVCSRFRLHFYNLLSPRKGPCARPTQGVGVTIPTYVHRAKVAEDFICLSPIRGLIKGRSLHEMPRRHVTAGSIG